MWIMLCQALVHARSWERDVVQIYEQEGAVAVAREGHRVIARSKLESSNPRFARLLSARAESLASSGKLKSALALLDMATGARDSGREDADIALLRERIDRASSESKSTSGSTGGYHQNSHHQPRSNGYSTQPTSMQPSSYGGGAQPMNPMMNTSFAAPPPPPVQQQQPFQPPPSYSAAPPPPPTQFTPPSAPAHMSAPTIPPANESDASFWARLPVPVSAQLPPQGSANTSFYAPSVPGAPGGVSTNCTIHTGRWTTRI